MYSLYTNGVTSHNFNISIANKAIKLNYTFEPYKIEVKYIFIVIISRNCNF